jgi:hypothetical protein
MKPLVARLVPLLLAAGTVFAVWLAFSQHEFTPRDRDDAYILTFIGSAYVVAALFLLAFTRQWSLRGLGQLGTYLGDAGLYLTAGGSRLGWRGPLTEAEANLIRALFVVGGCLLISGLAWWGIATHGGRRVDMPDAVPPVEPWNGEERRHTIRRAADRERIA